MLAKRSRVGYAWRALRSNMPQHRIYKITYQRPWGRCTVNTAQFQNETDLRQRFAQSYPDCELLTVEDVTSHFFPKNK